jgi:hypothetical protein
MANSASALEDEEMNETYLAWLVLSAFAIAFFTLIVKDHMKRGNSFASSMRCLFQFIALISAVIGAIFLLIWALSVVMK